MTTPLSGGRYIRDTKTGERIRVAEEQTAEPAAQPARAADKSKGKAE